MEAKLFALHCVFFLFLEENEKNRLRKIICSTEGYNRLNSLSGGELEIFLTSFRPFSISEKEWEQLKKMCSPEMKKNDFEAKKNRERQYIKNDWYHYLEEGGYKPNEES